MMNKIGEINFKAIKRISPSQFYSMKNCAYKSLLAEAFDKKPLLPISPYAYFGTIIHKMIELIAIGIVKNEKELDKEFDHQVKIIEEDLMENGLAFFVPLKLNIKNFGVKKIQLKDHLNYNYKSSKKLSDVKFQSEKWLESKDRLIGGKVDLIIEKDNQVEIIDFKTGAITQDYFGDEGESFSEIKEEYKDQLKLYAYLYFENTNIFPSRLVLIDNKKQEFEVPFSQEECKNLFEEAKELLWKTNRSITEKTFSAEPKEENCNYCLYRPACRFHLEKIRSNPSIRDISGMITSVKKYGNGSIKIWIKNYGKLISISGLKEETYENFLGSINKEVAIYNLKKENIEGSYSASKTTFIYEDRN
jgi:CRISPR/Cas system-associated exonuclease Cas4 (RecB family)